MNQVIPKQLLILNPVDLKSSRKQLPGFRYGTDKKDHWKQPFASVLEELWFRALGFRV